MSNLFDSTNYPETEPAQIIAGDRVAWKRTDLGVDYPPASYALSYSARLEGSSGTSSEEIAITATESGDDYIVEVSKATTAAYEPGVYHWQAYITRSSDSERITIDSGTFEVKANRDSATTDPRSHAKIVLEAIEAILERRATRDQESYTINNRALSRTPIKDLLLLRDRYRAEVRQEQAAEKIANGLGNPRDIGIRLNRG